MYTCPVCGYNQLDEPPADFNICESCGTEFGYHDARRSHLELRMRWLANGAKWHSRAIAPPLNWNAYNQLRDAGWLPPVKFTTHARVSEQVRRSARELFGFQIRLSERIYDVSVKKLPTLTTTTQTSHSNVRL